LLVINGTAKKTEKTRLMIMLPAMSAGGAERVTLNLLKKLPREQFEIYLVLIKDGGEFLAEVPADVTTYILKKSKLRYAIPQLIRLIWKHKIEVVFPTLGGFSRQILMIKWFFPSYTRIMIRETIAQSGLIRYKPKRQRDVVLNRWLYKKADTIVSLCQYMAADLQKVLGINLKNQQVIYNPVDIEAIKVKTGDGNPLPAEGIHIVAAGRLESQKGFERLIMAFPALLKKKPQAHLWIIGEGQLRSRLEALIEKLGLKDKIHLPGYQENPYKWIRNADLFVLSSLYEGLPNILLEAIACSCPVICLENPSGTLEILELTGQPERYVKELTWEDWWFDRPTSEVLEKLEEYFNIEKIVARYSEVLR